MRLNDLAAGRQPRARATKPAYFGESVRGAPTGVFCIPTRWPAPNQVEWTLGWAPAPNLTGMSVPDGVADPGLSGTVP